MPRTRDGRASECEKERATRDRSNEGGRAKNTSESKIFQTRRIRKMNRGPKGVYKRQSPVRGGEEKEKSREGVREKEKERKRAKETTHQRLIRIRGERLFVNVIFFLHPAHLTNVRVRLCGDGGGDDPTCAQMRTEGGKSCVFRLLFSRSCRCYDFASGVLSASSGRFPGT